MQITPGEALKERRGTGERGGEGALLASKTAKKSPPGTRSHVKYWTRLLIAVPVGPVNKNPKIAAPSFLSIVSRSIFPFLSVFWVFSLFSLSFSFPPSLTSSYPHSLICSLTHLFHSLSRTLICSFSHCFTHSFTHSLDDSLAPPFVLSHSFIFYLTPSLAPSLTDPLICHLLN